MLGSTRLLVATTKDPKKIHVRQGTQTGTKRTLVVQLSTVSLGEARLELCLIMSNDFSYC